MISWLRPVEQVHKPFVFLTSAVRPDLWEAEVGNLQRAEVNISLPNSHYKNRLQCIMVVVFNITRNS